LAETVGSTAEGCNTAVQVAQPNYRDTIFGEIQNLAGFLIQICDVLADNTDAF
jgi:hypothetical protein